MVISGNRSDGSAVDEVKGGECSTYLELSLQGRWIALAHNWLLANTPCPISNYFNAVIPLMPIHIRDRRNLTRKTQFHLASAALKRKELGVVVKDDFIVSVEPRKNNRMYDHESTLRDWVQADGSVLIPFGKSKKKDAMLTWLRHKGYKRIARLRYARTN